MLWEKNVHFWVFHFALYLKLKTWKPWEVFVCFKFLSSRLHEAWERLKPFIEFKMKRPHILMSHLKSIKTLYIKRLLLTFFFFLFNYFKEIFKKDKHFCIDTSGSRTIAPERKFSLDNSPPDNCPLDYCSLDNWPRIIFSFKPYRNLSVFRLVHIFVVFKSWVLTTVRIWNKRHISEISEFSILGIGQDRQLRNGRNVRFFS